MAYEVTVRTLRPRTLAAVRRPFADADEVRCVTTPTGEAAVVVHRGSYETMRAAHEAIHDWCTAHRRPIGGHSLEIYGDWSDDPSKIETTIQYLLRPAEAGSRADQ